MMNRSFVLRLLTSVLFLNAASSQATNCVPADLMFCSFPVTGFKVGRINDLDLGDSVSNVDLVSNQLHIDVAQFGYDETQIHTTALCNDNESALVGRDVEIAFTLDVADNNQRTISEIWVLPCNAVQLR